MNFCLFFPLFLPEKYVFLACIFLDLCGFSTDSETESVRMLFAFLCELSADHRQECLSGSTVKCESNLSNGKLFTCYLFNLLLNT